MLAERALAMLGQQLRDSLGSMGIADGAFGRPQLAIKAAQDVDQSFRGYTKAGGQRDSAYAAALACLRGQALNDWQRDVVAEALSVPVREVGGSSVLGSERLDALLGGYGDELKNGYLHFLTWHRLLYSYFSFDLSGPVNARAKVGLERLRVFLAETWPGLDRQYGQDWVPDWMRVLRGEYDLLKEDPTTVYAAAFLAGDESAVEKLASDVGIPPTSWFWHALVLGAVKQAAGRSDDAFRKLVPRLIELVKGKPGFRDEALKLMLQRCYAGQEVRPDEALREYVCHQSVWKNPKLKPIGSAPAWNQVDDGVWRMVLAWVNERNLRDFFDILAARNAADEGRLEFWTKYLNQIASTRLVFGAQTMQLQRSNASVRALIAREEGSYAMLTANRDVDAFMMRIGRYFIVEFSKQPNACYIYEAEDLPFMEQARQYLGDTTDLKAGYHGQCAERITHTPGWQYEAAAKLGRLGIHPDGKSAVGGSRAAEERDDGRRTSRAIAGSDSAELALLQELVRRYPGAAIEDKRHKLGGRLWVSDPRQNRQLEAELRLRGFKWAQSKSAWYFAG